MRIQGTLRRCGWAAFWGLGPESARPLMPACPPGSEEEAVHCYPLFAVVGPAPTEALRLRQGGPGQPLGFRADGGVSTRQAGFVRNHPEGHAGGRQPRLSGYLTGCGCVRGGRWTDALWSRWAVGKGFLLCRQDYPSIPGGCVLGSTLLSPLCLQSWVSLHSLQVFPYPHGRWALVLCHLWVERAKRCEHAQKCHCLVIKVCLYLCLTQALPFCL